MKIASLALAGLLLTLPLAACGDDQSAATAMVETRVEEARLKDFVPLLPAAPAGWTAEEPKFLTADDKSMVSKVYDKGTDKFSVEITFSNGEAAKFKELINDQAKRNRAGADLADFGNYQALSFERNVVTPAQYVVVATPSRVVSITPLAGDKIKPMLRAVFEHIDFDGIAAK